MRAQFAVEVASMTTNGSDTPLPPAQPDGDHERHEDRREGDQRPLGQEPEPDGQRCERQVAGHLRQQPVRTRHHADADPIHLAEGQLQREVPPMDEHPRVEPRRRPVEQGRRVEKYLPVARSIFWWRHPRARRRCGSRPLLKEDCRSNRLWR